MERMRSLFGLIAGALMLVSGGAHSFFGWKVQREALLAANAPADLISTLGLGWHFGGVAMLAFGCMVIALFAKGGKGSVPVMPAAVIATTYLTFGLGAMIVTKLDPFFLVFVVPGALLLLASFPRRSV